MQQLSPEVYVPVAGALIAGYGVLAAAIRRLYADARNRDDAVRPLIDRALVAMEQMAAGLNSSTTADEAMRNEMARVVSSVERVIVEVDALRKELRRFARPSAG